MPSRGSNATAACKGTCRSGDHLGTEKASVEPSSPMFADADLRAVVEAWSAVPAPIKAGILPMVKAAKP
jgi:hypothetical protein